MIPTLASAPHDLQNLKVTLLDLTGLGRDALHIYAGLTVFIVVRLLWRWRGGWILAWIAALALALGIEWLDMRAEGVIGAPQPDANHWHDVWNTMFWPTILLLAGRWMQPRSKAKEAPSDEFADEPLKETPPV